ncbi:hypothetical protein BDW02DRAFT_125118 [Decorospora gaudefroyi]|uniref:Uncharacterized protein n=1 Tax=Decorospora gaudefroyi TaxID=184978 RepID=A0A6A5JY84_9PLEO|nr:hypothetical protein BDW02DRAFT_125118 [Decorospora gaudefroyi]
MRNASEQGKDSVIPPKTFHGWSRLPDELQLEVLSHHLIYYTLIRASTHRELLNKLLFPLIGTRNRHLANLAQEVYYRGNQFAFCISQLSFFPSTYPKPPMAAMILHLHIKAVADFPADRMSGTWDKVPLLDRKTPGLKPWPNCQTTFTNLRTLKIVWDCDCVELRPPPGGCCYSTTRLEELPLQWDTINILFQADKVNVAVLKHRDLRIRGDELCEAHDDIFQGLKDRTTRKR